MGQKLDIALGEHIIIDSGNIPDDIVVESDVGPGAITATELATDAVTPIKIQASAVETAKIDDLAVTNGKIAAGTIQGAKLDVFASAEIAGTGSEADTAHSLGHTPDVVIVYITQKDTTTAFDLVEGIHDATNIKVNLETTCKYKIVAF